MLRSKQAVQVDSSQLDLIALRLPKPRPASRRPSLRLASFREFLEQTVVRHRHLRDHSDSESRYAEPSKRDPKSVAEGRSVSVRVDLGGRRHITKNKQQQHTKAAWKKTQSNN